MRCFPARNGRVDGDAGLDRLFKYVRVLQICARVSTTCNIRTCACACCQPPCISSFTRKNRSASSWYSDSFCIQQTGRLHIIFHDYPYILVAFLKLRSMIWIRRLAAVATLNVDPFTPLRIRSHGAAVTTSALLFT